MKSPAFQFYPTDWLGSTAITLMSPAEEGAYIHLLCHAWGAPDCGLPDDDEALAKLSRLDTEWGKGASTTLRKCFTPKGNRLYNERLLAERKKQTEWREKSAKGGKNSAKRRHGKRLGDDKGGTEMVDDCLQPNGNTPVSSLPSPSPSPSISPTSPSEDVEKETAQRPSTDWTAVEELWNRLAVANNLPTISKMTTLRKKHYQTRLRQTPDLWEILNREVPQLDDFAHEGSWFTFDWIMKSETNLQKLAEGKYRKDTGPPVAEYTNSKIPSRADAEKGQGA